MGLMQTGNGLANSPFLSHPGNAQKTVAAEGLGRAARLLNAGTRELGSAGTAKALGVVGIRPIA